MQIEAYSVEDDGDGICFNVYCFNVQPDITIDYATGASQLTSSITTTAKQTTRATTKTNTKKLQKQLQKPKIMAEKAIRKRYILQIQEQSITVTDANIYVRVRFRFHWQMQKHKGTHLVVNVFDIIFKSPVIQNNDIGVTGVNLFICQ